MMASAGRGLRTRGGRGFNSGGFSRYKRFDNNIFTMLGDLDEDNVQDGGVHGMFTPLGGSDDGFIPVRGKQSKRQRIRSGGQSGPIGQPDTQDDELFETDFQDLSTDQNLSLILSKLSVNESRVSSIQTRIDVYETLCPQQMLVHKGGKIKNWGGECRDVTPTKSLSQNIRVDVNREAKFL